ncbi:MAG: hypothetical protein HKN21_03990 [Candidatus Eisenbacteria bacterium]|uniref:Uncharacterized protein n=1 Tax=Eiseniibacteriota bacterium TaxID=2212470 RepID=A0A7Y2E7Q6_UNCEI|nr:hypothetical protein [Candidatus Eisenbacteria bacterium]
MEPRLTRSNQLQEDQKIRHLRARVDEVIQELREVDMPLDEAVRMVRELRDQALKLFPGKEHTYDLLYAPRLARTLREKYRIHLEAEI